MVKCTCYRSGKSKNQKQQSFCVQGYINEILNHLSAKTNMNFSCKSRKAILLHFRVTLILLSSFFSLAYLEQQQGYLINCLTLETSPQLPPAQYLIHLSNLVETFLNLKIMCAICWHFISFDSALTTKNCQQNVYHHPKKKL